MVRNEMIPKKIHYCWFGPKPLPKLVIKCIESWKIHLNDYEFYLWNEKNSPMDNPFVQNAYKEKKYAFVADYIRFWALVQHGGVYLDTDMFVVRSFDNLLDNGCFFAWETPERKIISCGVVGSVQNNDFLKDMLNSYNKLPFDLKNKESMIVTRHISRLFHQYNNKASLAIYPYDYFYPFPYEEKENVRNFRKYITENSYAVHLWNVSWGSPFAKIRDKVYYYFKTF